MVSSSPTQVAPFPTVHSRDKTLGMFTVSPDSALEKQHMENGYTARPTPAEHFSPLGNGSANSADTISEPSTKESTDMSPRSESSDKKVPDIRTEVADSTPDEQHNYHDAKEQTGGANAHTGTHPGENTGVNTNGTTGEQTAVGHADSSDTTLNHTEQQQQQQQQQEHLTPQAAEDNSKPQAGTDDEAKTTSDPPQPSSKSTALSTASNRAAVAAATELTDDVLVGTRVSEGHENFVTAYNMLTGIRLAVSSCTAKELRSLTEKDFTATEFFEFRMRGDKPASKYSFQFKDYAPWVFRHLRNVFRLDPAGYLMSLTAKYIVSELGSPGKSGSFFYYSRDYRFIIKTIHHSEHKLLRRILKQYYSHVQSNPDTLISQFYGLHRVRLPFGRKIHFVVMNNVFPALYEIHERYDLKGSLLGREYHPNPSKPIVVYKDLDWLRKHRRMVLGPEKRERLVKQLEIDTKFLERVNVMDYSLLVGIHEMSKGNAALKSLLKLEEFGPQNALATQLEREGAEAALNNHHHNHNQHNAKASKHYKTQSAQKDFADLQALLEKATPEKLKEFDFADEYRSNFFFYKDYGGYQSTNDKNEDQDVIYYIGVIDFLTGYTFRKSVETFCKSLIHDRKELSAVPAMEYGERFLKFIRGSIGPAIPSSKPQKRGTTESKKANEPPLPIINKSTAQPQSQSQPETQKEVPPVPPVPPVPQVPQATPVPLKSPDQLQRNQNQHHQHHVQHKLHQQQLQQQELQRLEGRPSSSSSRVAAAAAAATTQQPRATPSPSKSHSSQPRTPSKSTTSSILERSPSAITSYDVNGTTRAKPASPMSDNTSRRPSVVGYGQDAVNISDLK